MSSPDAALPSPADHHDHRGGPPGPRSAAELSPVREHLSLSDDPTPTGATVFEATVAALHREIGDAAPEPDGWESVTTPGGVEVSTQVLAKARDERNTVFLDIAVYRAAINRPELSQSQQVRLWHLHSYVAGLAATAAKSQTSSPRVRVAKRNLAAATLAHESRAFTMRELEFIDTEAGFVAHLRVLKDRSGLGIRGLEAAMKDRDPKLSPGHSTLATWFRGDVLPPAGGKVIALLVEVLLENIDEMPDVPSMTQEHVRVWRTLIAQRYVDAFRGPTRRAFDKVEKLLADERLAP